MALKTRVLVSGINNLSDARYCAGMGVEMMGFNFNINDNELISKESFKEIAGWISGAQFLGEFGDSTPDYIVSVSKELGLGYIEVDRISLIAHLKPVNIPIILKINISKYPDPAALGQIFNDYEHAISFFNLETTGTVTEEYWIKITELMMNYPILLGFNTTPENVNDLIESTKLAGISLKGGFEPKPGYKDFDELAEILEAIEIDDML